MVNDDKLSRSSTETELLRAIEDALYHLRNGYPAGAQACLSGAIERARLGHPKHRPRVTYLPRVEM